MEQKLKDFWTNTKAFCKKYWLYILIALAAIVGIAFLVLGGGKDNFWFKKMKQLMEDASKTSGTIQSIYKDGREKEDKIRNDAANNANQINQNAANEVKNNDSEMKKDAQDILSNTDGDPAKMAEELNKTFGIPVSKE